MKKHSKYRLEAVSEFLDDEMRDGAAIRAVLEQDEELAQRFANYRAMGAALRGLPAPDVHPAFRTRVMAQIRESAPAGRHHVGRRAGLWSAFAVAALVLIVAALWHASIPFSTDAPRVSQTAADAPVQVTTALANHLEAMTVAEVESLAWSVHESDFTQEVAPPASTTTWDTFCDQIADVLDADAKPEELLDALNAEQTAELKRMLVASSL